MDTGEVRGMNKRIFAFALCLALAICAFGTPGAAGAEEATQAPAETQAAQYATYQLNDYSLDIKVIQLRLLALRYLEGEPDGWFGAKTRSAVRRFQLVNGLENTGVADDATQRLLFSEAAKPSPAVLMSLKKLKALMNRSDQLGVEFDLSSMVVEGDRASVEINNYVSMSCELLGDGVTKITLKGKDNVRLPFTVLLLGIGAEGGKDALDRLIEQGEAAVGGMRVRYEQANGGQQRLIVTPIESTTPEATSAP